jgi:hypothetical protein
MYIYLINQYTLNFSVCLALGHPDRRPRLLACCISPSARPPSHLLAWPPARVTAWSSARLAATRVCLARRLLARPPARLYSLAQAPGRVRSPAILSTHLPGTPEIYATQINFCNIEIKHLQHTSETAETLATYV